MAGPFPREQVLKIRLGIIPKSTPGEWRLILHQSYLLYQSVNDGIAKELCSLQYQTVDQAISDITKLGKGTILAKIDIKHAYRNIPVHPADHHLLGMLWKNEDMVLPFGL